MPAYIDKYLWLAKGRLPQFVYIVSALTLTGFTIGPASAGIAAVAPSSVAAARNKAQAAEGRGALQATSA